nr:unnamed protein product [Callosobruchus chinensis]
MKDELIDLVFCAPAIWDKRHKQHHNRHALERQWKKIAEKIRVTETEARKCWKNLRQEYGKQIKKMQGRSGDEAGEKIVSQWPYFEKLHFLRDQFIPRESSTNLIDETQDSMDSNSEEPNHSEQFDSDDDGCTPASTANVMSPNSEIKNDTFLWRGFMLQASHKKYLATGCSFKALAFSFRMGASTVGKIIKEVCAALWEVFQPLHMKQPTTADFLRISEEYNRLWDFPNCIGALDGKHIRIKCPSHSGSMFFNYKHYFSIVLHGLVDDHYRFISIDVGGYGKQSDGGTFQTSKLSKLLVKNKLYLAYPLKENLMKPYSGKTLNPSQENFNKRLPRAQKTVECAFGILFAKWRIISSVIETGETTADIIKAICILHNIIIEKESYLLNVLELPQIPDTCNLHRSRSSNSSTNRSKLIRQKYTEFFAANPLNFQQGSTVSPAEDATEFIFNKAPDLNERKHTGNIEKHYLLVSFEKQFHNRKNTSMTQQNYHRYKLQTAGSYITYYYCKCSERQIKFYFMNYNLKLLYLRVEFAETRIWTFLILNSKSHKTISFGSLMLCPWMFRFNIGTLLPLATSNCLNSVDSKLSASVVWLVCMLASEYVAGLKPEDDGKFVTLFEIICISIPSSSLEVMTKVVNRDYFYELIRYPTQNKTCIHKLEKANNFTELLTLDSQVSFVLIRFLQKCNPSSRLSPNIIQIGMCLLILII